MELNLWNSNQILQEWLGKHCRTVLKCDFEFDVANPSSNSLIDTISEKFKIKKECIALSAGISELIYSIFSAPLWEKVYIFNPEFGLYKRSVRNSMYINRTIFINMQSIHALSELVEQYETNPGDLLCISSPNWYSGERMNCQEIIRLLDSFHGTIVIDEAYVDYTNEPAALIELAETNDRVILLRSFSKGWFVSGLRVGYMVSKKYAEQFKSEIIAPHSISTPSMRIVQNLLNDEYLMNCFRATRNDVIKIREYLKRELRDVEGCVCFQSESNFLTILIDERFKGEKDTFPQLFGVKIMDIQMNGKTSLKYWISNMENAEKLVELLKR